mgnify:CR=1 FL=1
MLIRNKIHRIKEKNSRLGLILFLFFLLPFSASAQTDTIRYVKMAKDGGKYANDGLSWDKAKDNVQDAINDLYDYMQRNNLHSSSVYVAGGKYEPSESTGDGAKGILSTSFKIYDGIHLYGGFNPATPETTPDKRMLSSHPAWRSTRQSSEAEVSRTFGEAASDTLMDYDFKYATVLSGNHNSSMETTFKWNDTKKQFDTRFPGNSYHVVWFATKGFISDANKTGYADSLVYGASLDGFVIQEGNASGKTIARRDHTTMGGGAYMVKHATIRNCSASRRGGGVYMDNGGTLQNSLVYSCQTLGLGIIDGYGGGLCVDNDGAVKCVLVTNNVGRIGGGAVIIYEPDSHPRGGTKFKVNDFYPYIADAVVANNTGTTEGGGVLLYKGGVMNHCTIVNNDCPGTDIVISNVRYGRSGGLSLMVPGSASTPCCGATPALPTTTCSMLLTVLRCRPMLSSSGRSFSIPPSPTAMSPTGAARRRTRSMTFSRRTTTKPLQLPTMYFSPIPSSTARAPRSPVPVTVHGVSRAGSPMPRATLPVWVSR